MSWQGSDRWAKSITEERSMRIVMRVGLGAQLLFVFVIGGLNGCSSRPAGYPETARVSGTVTLDGVPQEGCSITFSPSAGRSSSGKTDAAGRYELYYTGRIKGAIVGQHRVSISRPLARQKRVDQQSETDAEATASYNVAYVEAVPKRYHGIDSELSAEVEAGRNVIDFELTSEPSSRQP
jgi:hypothetical protein